MDEKSLADQSVADLVEGARDGSLPGAYTELIRRHYPASFARAKSILKHTPDAEDAVQDALVRALLKLDQLEDPQRFGGWLDRIVVRACVSKVRRKHPERPGLANADAALDQLQDEGADPETAAIAEEREDAVMQAIDELPGRYREPIRLFHLEGRSYKNIAEALNLPMGTVQSLISRARVKLAIVLAPYSRSALYVT